MPRKSKSKSTSKKSKRSDKKSDEKPKFKFVCQNCGKCCETETILVSISDLERWVNDQTIFRVMHKLELQEIEENYKLVLIKDDDGKCNLYHRDNKMCMIYDSRPVMCRSYPLGFNGQEYFVKNNECKGLNKEDMTKEQLDTIRNHAFEEHIAHRQMDSVFPLLYSLIFNKLIKDSQAFMNKLGDSDGETKDTDISDEKNK